MDSGMVKLRFFRDIVDDQRRMIFIALGIDPAVVAEAYCHSHQIRLFNLLEKQGHADAIGLAVAVLATSAPDHIADAGKIMPVDTFADGVGANRLRALLLAEWRKTEHSDPDFGAHPWPIIFRALQPGAGREERLLTVRRGEALGCLLSDMHGNLHRGEACPDCGATQEGGSDV